MFNYLFIPILKFLYVITFHFCIFNCLALFTNVDLAINSHCNLFEKLLSIINVFL